MIDQQQLLLVAVIGAMVAMVQAVRHGRLLRVILAGFLVGFFLWPPAARQLSIRVVVKVERMSSSWGAPGQAGATGTEVPQHDSQAQNASSGEATRRTRCATDPAQSAQLLLLP